MVTSVRVQSIHAMHLIPLRVHTVPVQLEDNSLNGPILIKSDDVALPDAMTIADSDY